MLELFLRKPYSVCASLFNYWLEIGRSTAERMVRERTPARAPSKHRLGDSWVVESDGDDEAVPPPAITSPRQADVRQKVPRSTTRASAEPELIMPSGYHGSVSSFWLGDTNRRRERGPSKTRIKAHTSEDSGSTGSALSQDRKSQNQALADFMSCVRPIISWTYEVFGGALHILKRPISYLLTFWLLIGILVLIRNLFFHSLYSAISPVCRVPGASLLNLPMCRSFTSAKYSDEGPSPIRFDQLMMVQNKFDEVLQESAGGVSLPLDMKKGETSIRDLRQIVRFSQLHSKNELVLEFDGFIETSRIASYDLQKFNSHVGRGVDNILATARWTKRVLDGIAEHDASQGALSSFVNDKILAPFQPLRFTEDTLLDQYAQHTRLVEDEINRLVVEAQALLLVLQNLEDRLDVIHGIAIRDDLHAQGGKNEVLSQLWTMLGGNRNKLGKFDSQLSLLKQVNTYRQNAIAHVSGTLIRLQSMGAELEELRQRVGSVELLGGKGGVPLSLHIENIEMGVERLERGRRGAKELENEELKKTLERGKCKNDRTIDGV